jgi:hypothetical protein
LVDVDEDDARKALVHYINSRTGRRVAKNALLKEMRKWLDENDAEPNYASILLTRTRRLSDGATYLLELATQKPDWYGKAWPLEADLIGAERQHRLVSALGHESAKPLLVAGTEELKAGQFRAMLGVLERIAMRSFICGTVHKSTLADFHIDQAKRMRSNKSAWSPESMWADALSPDLGAGRPAIAIAEQCPDELFIERVQDLRYTGNRNIIAYLMLGIESFDFSTGRPSDEVQFHWKDIHLDHVTPQSAEDDPVVKEGLVHTIGNLVPLSGRKNAKLKDLPYGHKKGVAYKQSKLLMTREVGMNERWTPEDVVSRTKQLAIAAASVWGLAPTLWDVAAGSKT